MASDEPAGAPPSQPVDAPSRPAPRVHGEAAPDAGAGNASSVVAQGFSLLQRTALTLALSAVLIAGTAIAALELLVVQPMSERWAADEAGLLELAARTWWQLPEDARPDFELELAERHDLIISNEPRLLQPLPKVAAHLAMLRSDLSARLDVPVTIGTARSARDDLVWVAIAPPLAIAGARYKGVGATAHRLFTESARCRTGELRAGGSSDRGNHLAGDIAVAGDCATRDTPPRTGRA